MGAVGIITLTLLLLLGNLFVHNQHHKKQLHFCVTSQFSWIPLEVNIFHVSWLRLVTMPFVKDRTLDPVGYSKGVVANKVCSTIRFVEEPSNYHCPSHPSPPPSPNHIEEVRFDLGDFSSLHLISAYLPVQISIGNVAIFRYLWGTVTTPKLHSWNASYNLPQNRMAVRLRSIKEKIKIRRHVILPIVCNRNGNFFCYSQGLSFDCRVLRIVFWHREEGTGFRRQVNVKEPQSLHFSRKINKILKSKKRFAWNM